MQSSATKFVYGVYPTVPDMAATLLRRAGLPCEHRRLDEIGLRTEEMTLGDMAVVALRHTGPVCGSGDLAVREAMAVSGGEFTNILSTSVGLAALAGYSNEPDSTRQWTRETNLPTFGSSERIQLAAGESLDRLPRGNTAGVAAVEVTGETMKLARYAKQLILDEQDCNDDRIGGFLLAAAGLGAAARRLRTDLIYSILLANAAMNDTGALFNATAVSGVGGHANLGTGALTAATLATACAAMGSQIEQDVAGKNIHLNLQARFLIIPQNLVSEARTALHGWRLGNAEDIQLRIESRLSGTSLWDPSAEETRTGSATNWLLACPAKQRETVISATLDGRVGPAVSEFELPRGQWGRGWNAKMDIVAKAVGWRGLYRSTGAA